MQIPAAYISLLSIEGLITWTFFVTNTGRLLAYVPQFISAWNCQQGAKSVSILTWSYFTFAHGTALLYSMFVLRDPWSMWIFAGNLAITVCLVVLLLIKRRKFGRIASCQIPPNKTTG